MNLANERFQNVIVGRHRVEEEHLAADKPGSSNRVSRVRANWWNWFIAPMVDAVDIVGFRRQVPFIEGSKSIRVHLNSDLGQSNEPEPTQHTKKAGRIELA